MSRDELQRQSLEAALGDVRTARVECDDVAGWVAAAGASPEDPLRAEPGQPAAWLNLDHSWESCFPDDLPRIRRHAQWLAGLAPSTGQNR